MDKKMLEEYIDACKLAEETERELWELEKKKVPAIMGKAIGSNPEFPFQKRGFLMHGEEFAYGEGKEFAMKKKALRHQVERAESIKRQIEEWLVGQPMRIQRIVRYRIFQRLSWEETAQKMGRGATGDSVRMEYRRFFEKK